MVHVKISEKETYGMIQRKKHFAHVKGYLAYHDIVNKVACLYSLEAKDKKRFEAVVNLSLLDDFNMLKSKHKNDLVQFLGNVETKNGSLQLVAYFCRVIRRIKGSCQHNDQLII
jgi:hypothetical protein